MFARREGHCLTLMDNPAGMPVRRGMFIFSCLAFSLAFFLACHKAPARVIGDLKIEHAAPLEWTELEQGLEYSVLSFTRQADGRKVEMIALRADPGLFSFRLLDAPSVLGRPSGWVPEMRAGSAAVAAVNGSFFLPENYDTIGMAVSSGRVINPWLSGAGSGLFVARDRKAGIVWAKKYDPSWADADFAIQAGPLVVEPGRKPGIYANKQLYRARTAVGVDRLGRAVFTCVRLSAADEGEKTGLDLYELMQIMLLPEKDGGLELASALNLDGGGSSAMSVEHPELELEIPSTSPVRNAIGIFRR